MRSAPNLTKSEEDLTMSCWADALECNEACNEAAGALIIKLKVSRLVCNQLHGRLEHTLDSLDLFQVSFVNG